MGKTNTLVTVDFKGQGTKEDPRVTAQMCEKLFDKVQDPRRRDACVHQAWAAAMALEWPHVIIRAWNHNTQYCYDENGDRVYEEDGEGNRRPKMVPADSHITVTFQDPEMDGSCHGHVYTVDDESEVPQRLMLINERKYTRDHDLQSPQLWWSDTKKLKKQLSTEKDDVLKFIQEQWVPEAILFNIEKHVDLTAATEAYGREFEGLTDEELLQWYVPEIFRRYEAALGKPQSIE